MKAEDLMIDDWVWYGNKQVQILQLSKDGKYRNVTPILLTPKILEKNDFKKFPLLHVEGQHQWTWWKNALIGVTLWCRELNDDTKDGMMLKIEAPTSTLCIKVNYVHEFQHTLRLCGIEKEIVL